ncbi:MAG: TIGR04282 family arsenosugar biosynthesis glycosyltransferase, partial [Halioglobus sp.]|nr:TIGR04282 family arsenosugar biosynthesis glycosyltransferase [Halioglobus sp.]
WTAGRLTAAALGPVELAVAGEVGHALFQRCLALGVSGLVAQRGADLGQRMHNALRVGLARYRQVVLVGSDCPGIDRAYLVQALAALEQAEVVLGRAEDGGYVLIGARRVCRAMFEGIPWGSAGVLAATTGRLRQLGLDWVELPALADIDRPGDLPNWVALRDH